MIIYKATNIVNGKCYIGQTVNSLEKRIKDHIMFAKNPSNNGYFQRAIRKYGWYSFAWEILCECDSKEELNEMEYHYIKQFQAFGSGGYNLTWGGQGRAISEPKDEVKIVNPVKKSMVVVKPIKKDVKIESSDTHKPQLTIYNTINIEGMFKKTTKQPVIPINLSDYHGVLSINEVAKDFNIPLTEAAELISNEVIRRQKSVKSGFYSTMMQAK